MTHLRQRGERFWNHELELDELAEIAGVIASVGGSAKDFEDHVKGPGARRARSDHQ
jgi:hypothetical protein